MLIALASHNPDIERLLEKGYALRVDGAHLVVRDVPYLDGARALREGALVMKLEFIDKVRVKPDNHVVFFAGDVPCSLEGHPIPNLGGGPHQLPLTKGDVVVQRSFSNKPPHGFSNFYDKVEHYITLIAGPAIELHGASPLTFNVDRDAIGESVFKLHDTLTSRAEIGDLAAAFKQDVIAIIGLGGSGAYLLDFMVKVPVKEIRGFDGDRFHVHNAFRAPGRLNERELGRAKAEVYQGRYENFRHGLDLAPRFIAKESAQDLKGVTFAFVCVDKGAARAQIFDLLISLGIPFIDVGMGLKRNNGPLQGTVRATYYSEKDANRMRQMKLAEVTDDPDHVYRTTVQLAELNALNAALAVIRYKQLRGMYVNATDASNLLLEIDILKMFSEAA